jgi:hypothetical protein
MLHYLDKKLLEAIYFCIGEEDPARSCCEKHPEAAKRVGCNGAHGDRGMNLVLPRTYPG